MDNLQLPALPVTIVDGKKFDGTAPEDGFTKLEYAALMMAQGIVKREFQSTYEKEAWKEIASRSTSIAKAVLEEANK